MSPPLCPRDATPLVAQADVLGPKCAGVLVDWKHGQALFQSLGAAECDTL